MKYLGVLAIIAAFGGAIAALFAFNTFVGLAAALILTGQIVAAALKLAYPDELGG